MPLLVSLHMRMLALEVLEVFEHLFGEQINDLVRHMRRGAQRSR